MAGKFGPEKLGLTPDRLFDAIRTLGVRAVHLATHVSEKTLRQWYAHEQDVRDEMVAVHSRGALTPGDVAAMRRESEAESEADKNPRRRSGRYSKAAQRFIGKKIRRLAREGYRGQQRVAVALSEARRRGLKVPARKNPALAVLANPGGAKAIYTLSDRVYALSYKHRADGKDYQHEFQRGVRITLLSDGRAVIWRSDGKPVWKQFA